MFVYLAAAAQTPASLYELLLLLTSRCIKIYITFVNELTVTKSSRGVPTPLSDGNMSSVLTGADSDLCVPQSWGGGGPWNCKPAGFFEHSTLCEHIIPLMQQHRPTKNLLSGHQQQTLQRAENSDLQAVPRFRQRLVIAVMFTCLWRHSHTDAGDYWQICAVPTP